MSLRPTAAARPCHALRLHLHAHAAATGPQPMGNTPIHVTIRAGEIRWRRGSRRRGRHRRRRSSSRSSSSRSCSRRRTRRRARSSGSSRSRHGGRVPRRDTAGPAAPAGPAPAAPAGPAPAAPVVPCRPPLRRLPPKSSAPPRRSPQLQRRCQRCWSRRWMEDLAAAGCASHARARRAFGRRLAAA